MHIFRTTWGVIVGVTFICVALSILIWEAIFAKELGYDQLAKNEEESYYKNKHE